MGKPIGVYLFGDQTFDVCTKLRDLLHSNDSPTLDRFFQQAYFNLRSEIAQLPVYERDKYPRFANLAELLAWRERQQSPNVALDNALTCIYQLGYFIR